MQRFVPETWVPVELVAEFRTTLHLSQITVKAVLETCIQSTGLKI